MAKRIISMILALVLVLGLIPAQCLTVYGAEEEIVTRAQWISQLVQAFKMEVQDNQYPDNYFSDLSVDSEYYYDMLLAVEFGVLDVEAGEAVRPDEAATREFAASTLNFCLGFQLGEDKEYTYSDLDAVAAKDDAQIALDRGWFALIGGKFMPEQTITAAEMATMMEDVASVLSEDVVDEEYNSTATVADGVVEVPDGTTIDFPAEGVVEITKCPVKIAAGDVFVVYYEKMPMAFKALEVETEGNNTLISYTRDGTDDALADYDYEGTIEADLEDFEGTGAMSYCVDDVRVYLSPTTRAINYDKGTKTLTASKTVSLGDGIDATISVTVSGLRLDTRAKKLACDYKCVLKGDATLTTNVSVDMMEVLGAAKTISLGRVPVAGIGYVELAVEFSLSGEMTLTWNGNFEAGFTYNLSDGFRLVKSFKKKSFTFMSEVTLRTGLKLSAGVDILVFDATIWAKIGAQMKVAANAYDSGKPSKCLDMSGFMYASVGTNGSIIKIFDFGKSYDIYTSSNSPIRAHYHYEDGSWVSSCTRGKAADGSTSSDYYTDPGSNNFTPGYSSGSSQYTSSTGTVVTVYTYTLNDDEEATITGYNGVGRALSIPKTIDGYTVIGIGNSAFKNRTSLYSVRIPNTVRTIGDYAFSGCTNLSVVTMPTGLESIGYEAFRNCKSLGSVDIADTVTFIDKGTFANCYKLYNVELPDSLVTLGACAFGNCTSLRSIHIPANVTDGGDYCNYGGWDDHGAFDGCTNLKTVTFAEGTTVIADYLFARCTGLEEIVIPDTVTTIESEAFREDANLKKVTFGKGLVTIGTNAFRDCDDLLAAEIPDTVTSIGNGAFYHCEELATVKLSKTLETLGACAFGNCDALTAIEIPVTLNDGGDYCNYEGWDDHGAFDGCDNLKTVTFEKGVVMIPDYLFARCTGLEEIVIPDTVTTIESEAFREASSLKKVTFGKGLVTIGTNAFRDCGDLLAAEIPDTVTGISNGAFYNCEELTTVKLSKTLETLGACAFGNCDALTAIEIPVTLNDGGDYCNYEGWDDHGAFDGCDNLKTVTFEKGVVMIPDYLFARCTGLEEIVIPDTVTTIESEAFREASSLKKVTFGKGLVTIGTNAFRDCDDLLAAEIPDTVTSIGNGAFYHCEELTTVKLSKGVVTLGACAFGNCDALTAIEIPKSLTDGGDYCNYEGWANHGAFDGCDSLKTVTFEEGVTEIPEYLFAGCTGLETITIPDTVTLIERDAFYACSALKEIVIPDSVTLMGDYTFELCTALVSAKLPNSRVTIMEGTFSGCTALESIIMPDTVETVSKKAFMDCVSLKEVKFSDSLTLIEENAFRNCDSLTNIELPGNLKTIQNSAFYDCDGLTEVTIPTGVRTIGNDCFYDGDALTKATVLYGTTSIGNNAFYDCDALETVAMANSVTKLGSYAFYHCYLLNDVTLSRNIQTISNDTFRECPALESIVIPYNCTKIADRAFQSSPKLTKVYVSNSITSISSSAFSYPTVTVFYGPADSYVKTWAGENGYTYNQNTTAATGISLSQSSLTMIKGATDTLDVIVTPADCGDEVTFLSSKPEAVTVDATGKITAVGVGSATIKVYVGNYSASCKVTVTQAVTRISLNRTNLSLDVPDTYQLTATVKPDDASDKSLTWTSSNERAATVDQNGLVTAVGNGTATITVTANDGSGISASCNVTVTDPNNIPVTTLTLSQNELSLDALATAQLTVNVKPTNAANKNVIWTSSDNLVATVDENGLVTGISKGTATITATAADGFGATVSCNVTVVNTAHIVDSVEALESVHPYESNCNDIWVYTIAGAKGLNVTFDEQTFVEEDFDFILIFDGEGQQIGEYTGDQLAGKTIEVDGSSVRIKLQSNAFDNQWGFKVATIEEIACVHNYVGTVTAPGCTTDGYTTYVCSECNDSYVSDQLPAVGHSYEAVVTAPTCTSGGYTTYTCTMCGDSYVGDETPAVDHSYEAVVTAPTCVSDGYTTYTCTMCGDSYVGDETPAVDHSYEAEVTPPTCTEGGHTLYSCSSCGDSYADDYTNMLGHDFVDSICTRCGEEFIYMEMTEVTASTVASTGKPQLSWTAVENAVEYQVHIGTVGGDEVTVTVTDTFWVHTDAVVGIEYIYHVHAVAKDGAVSAINPNGFIRVTAKLAAPTAKISGDAETGKPVIKWNTVEGTAKYRVYRSTKKTSGYKLVYTGIKARSYTDKTAEAGTNYYYKVKAYHKDSSLKSDWSNVVNRVCDLAQPEVGITGSSTSGKPIVKWETVTGAAKYRVYRSTKKTSGYELVYTGISARSYTDKTAKAGTTYYYKVKAIHSKSSADSVYSDVVSRLCDLAKPEVTIKLKNGDPRLTWEKVDGAAKYYIYRATSKDGKYTKIKTTVSATSFTDTTAKAGTKYYYKVKAIHKNTDANSAYSSIKYITAK